MENVALQKEINEFDEHMKNEEPYDATKDYGGRKYGKWYGRMKALEVIYFVCSALLCRLT